MQKISHRECKKTKIPQSKNRNGKKPQKSKSCHFAKSKHGGQSTNALEDKKIATNAEKNVNMQNLAR